jgi:hypothetical protein
MACTFRQKCDYVTSAARRSTQARIFRAAGPIPHFLGIPGNSGRPQGRLLGGSDAQEIFKNPGPPSHNAGS